VKLPALKGGAFWHIFVKTGFLLAGEKNGQIYINHNAAMPFAFWLK